jgi:Mg2+ and Co2+ transporter CorA
MRGTLKENAMLGRFDNFKDELYETRKILDTQISCLRKLEGKIKDVGNQAGNLFGICDDHVMQLNSSMNAMFGIIEEIRRSIARLSEGQMNLEKKIDDVAVKIGQRETEKEEAEKRNYCSRDKGKGKIKKESSDGDDERGNYQIMTMLKKKMKMKN